MAFPQDPLDVDVELQIAGAWTNVTGDVYHRDLIQIDRGRADEGKDVDPGKCTLTFNNRDGKYSPRNPLSPYYGLIGRNTPIRVSVNAGTPYLNLPGAIGDRASTPDTAALDITGDIDIRVDAQLSNWLNAPASAGEEMELVGKWTFGPGGKSWHLGIFENRLTLQFSPDGTNLFNASSPLLTIPASGRLAVRATLDVNNGAGGWTATFFTAPTLAGPWNQIGFFSFPGTTSIFNSSTIVAVGDASDVGYVRPIGRCYGLEIRNGINGTVVANPNFTAQTVGATSFTDGAGRTWTMNGRTSITNRQTRFVGEVSNWPPKWDVSGRDVYTPVEAAGILRRLGQGASPIQSTMRREFSNPARQAIVAYWPMEDGSDASSFASAMPGATPLAFGVPGIQPAGASPWPASDALPTMNDGNAAGPPPSYSVTGETALRFFLQLPTDGLPGSTPIIALDCSGTAARWLLSATSPSTLGLHVTDGDGDDLKLTSHDFGTTLGSGVLSSVGLELTQSGNTVNWQIVVQNIGTSTLDNIFQETLSGSLTGTVGRVSRVTVGARGLGSTVMGHVALANAINAYADTAGALLAWAGETAQGRIRRLCNEERVPLLADWYDVDTALVGPQRIDTVLALLQSATDADGGVLYEQRDAIGLAYRPRATTYNQTPALTLDYTRRGDVAPDLTPVEDDQQTRNDVTISRDGGASARVTLESGPLSVQPPPNGVGRYDDSVSLNLFSDGQAKDIAAWRLWLGTQDAARYPTVAVALNAGPHLIDAATAVDIRDAITITNLPEWLPPGDVSLIGEGYSETIGLKEWALVYNCNPGSPWKVGVTDDPVLGRADTDGSELAAAATSTATSIRVATTTGPIWTTDPAETPWDILAGGEVMTVTAVSPSLRDTFGRTVSGGWGATDTGEAWTVVGGSSTEYSVSGGTGRHAVAAVNSSRNVVAGASLADFDIQASVATAALAAGSHQFAYLVGRWIDTNNHYQARLQFDTTARVTLSLRKRLAGSEPELASIALSVAHAAGTFYTIRFAIRGDQLMAKAWRVGDMEPGWQITAVDDDLPTAGPIGVRSSLNTGNSNTLPLLYQWDNFQLVSPQTMTVIRAVNGISKSQAAGTDVRLAQPMILAL